MADSLCFVGSWFFTTAAWMQLALSDRRVRFEWSSAFVQFGGTVLFNLSTGAAVWAHAVTEERRYVWVPNVTGSIFFLVSGVLAMVSVAPVTGVLAFRSGAWRAAAVNLAGCVAFGVSAVSAFVRGDGVTVDEWLANFGTFLGALCFLVAALMVLPRAVPSGPP
ncbi:hypothetical protein [Mycolicibacterium gilvum]|uniref:YrhK domain-containing protein n=1 Tax=Mycolicibacterium gilvum TaxID=1804 RepID=A0A378SIZ8_9MYCO|nr:hypothetical protein [Mycolicibacterium gilvum]MCV7054245.1 hypothetical protein [Mycolicibacterium gilvum]STZ42802.1 Uncharacterised protein [Mycolicibacterium gilvum]